MPQAFVLINCDLGKEEEIIDELKTLTDVKEVHGVFGAYDIIAKVISETTEKMRNTITWKIRKLRYIRATLTLAKIEGQE